jgi:polysaccharide biosynthesis protein PslG
MWDRSAVDAPAALQRDQFRLMRRSGVESIRTTFSSEQAEPEAGRPPDFHATDRIVGLAARHGIHLLPVVVYTSFWARAVTGAGGTSPPMRNADYVRYVEQLVRRYGPRGRFWAQHPRLKAQPIRHWQVWNEQNLARFWWRGKDPRRWAPEFLRLLNSSYDAIKRLDPEATVVLGALGNKSWLGLARLYRVKARPRFDVAAINLYTARPGNAIRTMKIVRSVLRRQDERRTPLWLTEIIWPAAGGLPGPPMIPSWYTTTTGSARRVRRLYSLAADHRRRLRLERVYWYTWASPYSGHDRFDYTGLVRWTGRDFIPQPALNAFTAAAR